MDLVSLDESDFCEFVEVDPTGRYGRYNEILGKGASKTVYRAFDEYEGIEVAWNQVKLNDFLQSPDDLERLYSEIHLLKTLKHKNIMKFYTSWVDTANRNINFVTELFTSGTLRQYRLKNRRVNIRAVKHWCRQILKGLLYLHSHDPPVIHRDLKCDNIFINGNHGEVKIGDLGLAAILRQSHAAHCVGTPEFMAPEVYEEAYNELVDIYSFGMCILEMVTFEYPYSECTHPAQIYKKVTSGKKPDALYKVRDPELRQFVEKCLATVSDRLSARELLDDPFLKVDDFDIDLRTLDYGTEVGMSPLLRQPYFGFEDGISSYHNNGYSNCYDYEAYNDWEYHPLEIEASGIELFEQQDDEHSANLDVSVIGKKRDDGSIFLRLRIADKEGRKRNIYFPFDIESDTALCVATEMVAELDITDQDVTKIADIIDEEITSLVPEWRTGPEIEETPRFANQIFCNNCASTRTSKGSLIDYMSNNPCCWHGCASMHGRFEEITFQADESEDHFAEGAVSTLSQLNYLHHHGNWDQQESRQLTPMGSGKSHSDEEYDHYEQSYLAKDELPGIRNFTGLASFSNLSESNEDDVQWKLRWLKAKYQMEMRILKDQQLSIASKTSKSSSREHKTVYPALSLSTADSAQEHTGKNPSELFPSDELLVDIPKSHSSSENQRTRSYKVSNESTRLNDTIPIQSCYSVSLLPHSLHRTTSLPVDAVDV